MKRVTPKEPRGVTWIMGGPLGSGLPNIILAVTRATVVIRNTDGKWRTGTYVSDVEAGRYATSMTKKKENEGLRLIAGPVEFTYDGTDPYTDSLHDAILAALGLV